MTARWPDPDRRTIDHYLASLGLRGTVQHWRGRYILRLLLFQSFSCSRASSSITRFDVDRFRIQLSIQSFHGAECECHQMNVFCLVPQPGQAFLHYIVPHLFTAIFCNAQQTGLTARVFERDCNAVSSNTFFLPENQRRSDSVHRP